MNKHITKGYQIQQTRSKNYSGSADYGEISMGRKGNWVISDNKKQKLICSIEDAVDAYAILGFDTVPLNPNTKITTIKSWPLLSPAEMWKNALPDSNIGIRGGGEARLVVIDCDDKDIVGTFTNVQNWLSGLGIDDSQYPIVQTASGISRHIYLASSVKIDVGCKQYQNLRSEFGAGELRSGSGAYGVAPPSVVDECEYRLISGEFHNLPPLDLKDLSQLVGSPLREMGDEQTHLEYQPERRIPRNAKKLLCGEGINYYDTRSEAEQALITMLVNAGFEFGIIKRLFEDKPCAGKFHSLQSQSREKANRWLLHSFTKAVAWTGSHESEGRRIAKESLCWAESKNWKGRSGLNNKIVFTAHALIAYQAGKIDYHASARNLAEMTGLSPTAANNATKRLLEMGYLIMSRNAVRKMANTYKLTVCQSDTLPPSPFVGECNSLAHLKKGGAE